MAGKLHMKDLKNLKPYDNFNLKPETYDVKRAEQVKEKTAPTEIGLE